MINDSVAENTNPVLRPRFEVAPIQKPLSGLLVVVVVDYSTSRAE
jgi:hypothetical protein